MKIAVIAHVRQPIAEPFMGGMEAHSWHLTKGLLARGHEVVLFAAGDSDPSFNIDPILNTHYERTYPWAEHRGSAPLIAHVDAGFRGACERIAKGKFDVVHNNSLHRFPLQQAFEGVVPMVTSLHVPPFDALHWFVKKSLAPRHRLTVTSTGMLRAWWPDGAPPAVSVLHNGIDTAAWPFNPSGNGSAVWSGRITPNKGTHIAIAAARVAGISLTIFGTIEDEDYWQTMVKPQLGGDIRYGGHLRGSILAGEIGQASVFVFTPCWDEPFGLVAIEAMSCGVPIAALDMGAAREVVGAAGAIANAGDEEGLALAITEAIKIDRRLPRRRVVANFSNEIWLGRCEELYKIVQRNDLSTEDLRNTAD